MELLPDRRMDRVEERAAADPKYRRMMVQYKAREKRFEQFCKTLSDEQRAIVWEYVMICEDMSRRMLELACRENA